MVICEITVLQDDWSGSPFKTSYPCVQLPTSQIVFLKPGYITKLVYITKMQIGMSSWGQQKQSRIALSLKLMS